MEKPYLFAGDRRLAVDALKALLAQNDPPAVVVVSDSPTASHADELTCLAETSPGCSVVTSSTLSDPRTVEHLADVGLDFALSVHFAEIVKEPLLSLPRRGWLNLHPAFLPFNRGWHTPSWSILEGTRVGATIHVMTAELDAGEILAQREVDVQPSDTAHVLYGRLLEAELELLKETWPAIRGSVPWRLMRNPRESGTLHSRKELFEDEVQLIDLDAPTTARDVITKLRALTTDRWDESARFVVAGRTYRARIEIQHDGDEKAS